MALSPINPFLLHEEEGVKFKLIRQYSLNSLNTDPFGEQEETQPAFEEIIKEDGIYIIFTNSKYSSAATKRGLKKTVLNVNQIPINNTNKYIIETSPENQLSGYLKISEDTTGYAKARETCFVCNLATNDRLTFSYSIPDIIESGVTYYDPKSMQILILKLNISNYKNFEVQRNIYSNKSDIIKTNFQNLTIAAENNWKIIAFIEETPLIANNYGIATRLIIEDDTYRDSFFGESGFYSNYSQNSNFNRLWYKISIIPPNKECKTRVSSFLADPSIDNAVGTHPTACIQFNIEL